MSNHLNGRPHARDIEPPVVFGGSVSSNWSAFAVERFIDGMAEVAGAHLHRLRRARRQGRPAFIGTMDVPAENPCGAARWDVESQFVNVSLRNRARWWRPHPGWRGRAGQCDTCKRMRQADAPAVESCVSLFDGTGCGGIGEPGTPPEAAALAEAIFDAGPRASARCRPEARGRARFRATPTVRCRRNVSPGCTIGPAHGKHAGNSN